MFDYFHIIYKYVHIREAAFGPDDLHFLLLVFFLRFKTNNVIYNAAAIVSDDCEAKEGSPCQHGACLDSLCHCNDGYGGCSCQVPGKSGRRSSGRESGNPVTFTQSQARFMYGYGRRI